MRLAKDFFLPLVRLIKNPDAIIKCFVLIVNLLASSSSSASVYSLFFFLFSVCLPCLFSFFVLLFSFYFLLASLPIFSYDSKLRQQKFQNIATPTPHGSNPLGNSLNAPSSSHIPTLPSPPSSLFTSYPTLHHPYPTTSLSIPTHPPFPPHRSYPIIPIPPLSSHHLHLATLTPDSLLPILLFSRHHRTLHICFPLWQQSTRQPHTNPKLIKTSFK